MKEYTIASLAVLFLALGAVARHGLWRDRALWWGLLAFGTLTVADDGALTQAGVYSYERRFNSGRYLARMPLEDVGYGLALYLFAAAFWSGGRGRGE